MFGEFIVGIVQGVFIGMLLGALNINLFGKMLLFIENTIHGAPIFSGLIFIAILNIGMYFLFSRHSIRTNPTIFIFGLIVGIIFL
ncbi:MAG: hypothetical protein WC915_00335 [archaeon]|jgi:hypothetical protein